MPEILHRVGIKLSSDKVFKALAHEQGLAGGSAPQTERKRVSVSPAVTRRV